MPYTTIMTEPPLDPPSTYDPVRTLADEIKAEILSGCWHENFNTSWNAGDIAGKHCEETDPDYVEYTALGVIWKHRGAIESYDIPRELNSALSLIADRIDATADDICYTLAARKIEEAKRP